jgi:hypothetical protein
MFEVNQQIPDLSGRAPADPLAALGAKRPELQRPEAAGWGNDRINLWQLPPRWLKASQIGHQITHAQIQDLCDPRQGLQRDLLLRAFHFTDIVPVEIRPLSQLLLTELGLLALRTNRLTNDPVKLL